MPWTIERLDSSHAIAEFNCGEPSLNSFLQHHALNNDRAGLGRTLVAVDSAQKRVAGYFTISTGSVTFKSIPDYQKQRLPKYPIPTVHVGRLGVDVNFQKKGLGELLLIEALRKAAVASTSVGVYAVDVMALNDRAKSFYVKYGFLEMLDSPLHLFVRMEAVRNFAKMTEE